MGLGATYTLATWNDSEWVWGGAAGNTPGVGTETFEVQQNTTSPFSNTAWTNNESNPGDPLSFTTGALSLSPGDVIYAPVSLRTTAASVGATTTLQAAVAANQPGTSTPISVVDPDGDLWKSIRVSVYTETGAANSSPTAACNAGEIGDWGTALAGVTTLDTVATASQALTAVAGSTQHYCFRLEFPATLQGGLTATDIDQLQGRTIAPAWEFRSTSV